MLVWYNVDELMMFECLIWWIS